ncbi:MAG: aldo/keto reductase [bacterium]|nr:aldo/keto reductase [bacterium]
MLYRKMNKTGDELSILGFGCMRLPEKNGKIDEERATNQVRYAIDNGINYIDTAMPYHMGASEPFLGKALANGYRDKVKLATKLPPWLVKSREDMDKILNSQLERLNTDRIDYYLVHSLEAHNWKRMRELGVLDFLDRAKAAGKIINAGFSFHGDKKTFKEVVDSHDWDFCQIQYNFLDEDNQAGTEGLTYAASKGLGVIIMEPLRGGNLGGKVPAPVEKIWAQAETKRTPVEWALRWIWDHPEVTVILSGMNEEEHIQENIRVAGEALPESFTKHELQLVGKVRDTYRTLMKAGCTGCRYCIPCPAGVDIPQCFEIYNSRHMFNDVQYSQLVYTMRLSGVIGQDKKCYASLCKECGKCEKACPQQLPIQDLLKDISGEFEGTRFKLMSLFGKGFFAFQRMGALRQGKRSKHNKHTNTRTRH